MSHLVLLSFGINLIQETACPNLVADVFEIWTHGIALDEKLSRMTFEMLMICWNLRSVFVLIWLVSRVVLKMGMAWTASFPL